MNHLSPAAARRGFERPAPPAQPCVPSQAVSVPHAP
eukprot:COSAG05_NODE_15476_length_368_cov_4.159851_1_plen_35_part_01